MNNGNDLEMSGQSARSQGVIASSKPVSPEDEEAEYEADRAVMQFPGNPPSGDDGSLFSFPSYDQPIGSSPLPIDLPRVPSTTEGICDPIGKFLQAFYKSEDAANTLPDALGPFERISNPCDLFGGVVSDILTAEREGHFLAPLDIFPALQAPVSDPLAYYCLLQRKLYDIRKSAEPPIKIPGWKDILVGPDVMGLLDGQRGCVAAGPESGRERGFLLVGERGDKGEAKPPFSADPGYIDPVTPQEPASPKTELLAEPGVGARVAPRERPSTVSVPGVPEDRSKAVEAHVHIHPDDPKEPASFPSTDDIVNMLDHNFPRAYIGTRTAWFLLQCERTLGDEEKGLLAEKVMEIAALSQTHPAFAGRKARLLIWVILQLHGVGMYVEKGRDPANGFATFTPWIG